MRNSFYGLKTTVIVNLAFLIISAMVLLGIVVLKIIEKDMMKGTVNEFSLMSKMTQTIVKQQHIKSGQSLSTDRRETLIQYLNSLRENSQYQCLAIVNSKGKVILGSGIPLNIVQGIKTLGSKTILTNKLHINLDHPLFSPFSPMAPHIKIASPMTKTMSLSLALVGYKSMDKEWETIVHATGLISFYILVNGMVLLGFGLYIFHHRVISPINKMVQSVANIREGEQVFIPGNSRGNELGKLSKAINIMLQRLGKNKEELQTTITSLEAANQNLQKVQKELIHSEKMASVGRLAAGIAHEIGNPLGIILGYLGILKQEVLKDTDKRDLVTRMEKELERIRGIITQLLDFARPAKNDKIVTDLHQLLHETIELIKHQCAKNNITVANSFQATKSVIHCDPNQLKQVFLNIIFNALDSMENGGILEITTQDSKADPDLKQNSMLLLKIHDTGCGISRNHMEKIFDPFFTTKELGRGTGLGLSVSASILESVGGKIEVESEEAKGTTIFIKIPVMKSETS